MQRAWIQILLLYQILAALSCLGSIAEKSHHTNWLSNKKADEILYPKNAEQCTREE